MEVILLERVGGLGSIGAVVKVRDGFARNFLIPQKKAVRATRDNKAKFEAERAIIEARNAESRQVAEKQAETLKGATVTLERQASEEGHLYGALHPRDVADALTAAGHTVERSQVHIHTPIKALGEFTAQIVLHPEVTVDIPVKVTQATGDSHGERDTTAA